MKSIWKILTGFLALSFVLAAVVWAVPDGPLSGAKADSPLTGSVRTAGGGVHLEPTDPEQVLPEVYVSEPSVPTISPAVRDLPEIAVDPLLQREMMRREYRGLVIGEGMQGPAWLDPLVTVQSRALLRGPDAFTTPLTNWAGMDYNSYPPDATGDVGPNHVVQAVNGSGGSTVQIWNKSGTVLKTFTMDSLSSTAPCNNGYCDPIVIYDSAADRWFISEFSASSGNAMCLYVSTTPDPTGTWYAYTFDTPYFDYHKYGVWRDAYYMGYNGGPSGYVQVFAFDRAKMLAGQAATYQMFNAPELSGFSFQLLVPASLESTGAPPAGLGGLFVRPNDTEVNGPSGYPSTDFLEIFEFDVDWITPANSTLTKLPDVPIGEYDATLCGTGSNWSCMEQPNGQGLDPIREPIHQPLQYRNWGSYDTLVGGFAEDVDGADTAAVRWFELRRMGGAWSVHQEGVVGGGDDSHRSVTSVAMDGSGGIGLGYTLTSSTIYPSIRYAGRRAWDAPGTMPYVDVVAQAGTGSQATYNRWGDYSGIGIDPADDCTFWYTTEYMSGSTSATRMISLRHDADFSPDASPNALTVCRPADAIYTVQTAATCAFSGSVTLSASGLPGGVTASWGANPITPPGSTTLTIGNTGAAAVGSYNITITGVSGLITRSETVVLNVSSGEPLGAVSLASPADGTTEVSMAPTLTWQALAGAASYDIQVATDLAFTNIVRSATGLTGTSYTPSPALSDGAVYYWRVSANNACGAGAVSPAWAFRTAAVSCTTYTSTDVPKLVPPSGTSGTTTSIVTVSGGATTITDVNVTLGRLTHTSDADLDIYIRHPDATQVELSTDNGGSGDNYVNTVFDDEATTLITAGSAPFTGSFKPEGSLAALDGKAANGTWTLIVTDDTTVNSGTLTAWSLTICGASASTTDYGDLAKSYGIAWHTGNGVLKLGSLWTADTTFAAGHDDPGSGDGSDDGVARALNAAWGSGTGAFDVTATADGCLNAWMDFGNGAGVGQIYADGDFGDSYGGVSEQIIAARAVSIGTNNITFTVPPGILGPSANTYAFRFRLAARKIGAACSDIGSSAGAVTSGEVEDYQLTFDPLAVTLAGFTAEAAAEGVTLTWETVSETDNVGFNVYRGDLTGLGETCQVCEWVKLNDALIPAATPGSTQGNVYTWTDAASTAPGAYWYMLEDVDLNGIATRHEPVSVTLAEPNAVGLAGFSATGAAGYDAGWAGLSGWLALVALGGMVLRKRRMTNSE